MELSTDTLLEQLKSSKNIKSFLEMQNDSIPSLTLAQYLEKLIKDKNIRKSRIIKDSNLEKTYVYQIFRGERINPSRDKVLLLALAMKLEIDETRRLLKIAGCGDLYPKNERDSIIIYCILNGKSVIETNLLLFELKHEELD